MKVANSKLLISLLKKSFEWSFVNTTNSKFICLNGILDRRSEISIRFNGLSLKFIGAQHRIIAYFTISINL